MKNILSLFLVISLFSFLIFTGCGDDVTDLIKGSLKVTVKAADANVYQAGKEISYTVEISSNNKLKELIVTPTVGGVASTPTKKDLNNEYSLSYEYKFTIPSVSIPGTSIEIAFAVEDAAETKTEKVTITVVGAESPMGSAQSGVIYHMLGKNPGAWDLVTNAAKTSKDADADKDMANTTSLKTPAGTNYFEAKWKALNATTFVKASLNYDNVTIEAAEAAFKAGSAVAEVPEVAKGDIFVAKLRGGSDYAVIKVEDVVLTPNKSATEFDNNDAIKFSYKKKTTAKGASKNSPLVYY